MIDILLRSRSMPASLVSIEGTTVTVEVKVDLSRCLLTTEEAILAGLNEAGCHLTQAALKYFDTDGSPMTVGEMTLTSKGEVPKAYQTPYGIRRGGSRSSRLPRAHLRLGGGV